MSAIDVELALGRFRLEVLVQEDDPLLGGGAQPPAAVSVSVTGTGPSAFEYIGGPADRILGGPRSDSEPLTPAR